MISSTHWMQLFAYLGGKDDLTLHNSDAGFPTIILELLGCTVTNTTGFEVPGGRIKEDFTFSV